MKDFAKAPQANCYCGQFGDTHQNMMHCVKCKRWIHEGCVKCLDIPMLHGDPFFILVCSVCNAGSEYLARLELTWMDLVHLAIYNLTFEHNRKYFDLDKEIIPFVCENWVRFHVFGPISSVKSEDFRIKFLKFLEDKRFKCGKEIKKSKNIFGLREKVPPIAPFVQPSDAKLKNDVVIWEFQTKDTKYHILSNKKPRKSKLNKSKNSGVKIQLSSSQSHSKQNEVTKGPGASSSSCRENGTAKAKHKLKRTSAVFNEESAQQNLLDTLIPTVNFNTDNPFGHPTSNKPNKVERLNGSLHVEDSVAKLANGRKKRSYVGIRSALRPRKDEVFIVGKRATKDGKRQYLLQRNR